jgi:hypothetical protein
VTGPQDFRRARVTLRHLFRAPISTKPWSGSRNQVRGAFIPSVRINPVRHPTRRGSFGLMRVKTQDIVLDVCTVDELTEAIYGG